MDADIRHQVDEIVSRMSLEEKIAFVVGVGIPDWEGNPKGKVYGSAGETRPIERLGIPRTVYADGPAGLRIYPKRPNDERTYHATAFPVETMLASTWNRELVKRVGQAMGEEVREYGVDVLLAPAINIHRNPLCGRNFEYYSEDPLLSGELAASFVEGVQSQGVGACLKHFVANEQETNRMTIDTIVSERALREIYLKPFEIAIKKSKPWTVMSSYNKLNGSYTSQSEWLLKRILRDEWGFEGFVMTDWFAGDDPVEQLKAGNDLIMPGKSFQVAPSRRDEIEEIREAIQSGRLTEAELDERIRHILAVLLKTPSFRNYGYSNNPDLEAHARVAYEAGCEGVVLLKNDDVLPIGKDTPLAVFGFAQLETVRGGTGSGETHPAYTISFIDGMMERGLNVHAELAEFYRQKLTEFREGDFRISKGHWGEDIIPKLPEDVLDESQLELLARETSVAIFIISRISGEGYDRKPVKGDFYLSDDEFSILQKISRIFRKHGRKLVVILNIGSPIEVESWRELADAIVLVWQPGQEAGRILADILTGVVTPSGKLPTTFPKDYFDVPSKSFPGEPVDNPVVVRYDEGIYVGYRYYDTFRISPSFEFGYGLSYTKFEYSDLKVVRSGGSLVVSFKITNVGNFPGQEIAQVYVSAPIVKIDKPLQELKGFEKTRLINPGESQVVEIEIPISSLASYDGEKWVVEPGEYELRVGASSRDIRLKQGIRI